MKKIVLIILTLLIIFVGIIIYNKVAVKKNDISLQEIEKIENYIDEIYMWKELTNEAIPTFENINEANEKWIWEVVKKNIEEYEPTYEQIQETAKKIFGKNFTKEFPKEGTNNLKYNEQTNKYETKDIELDQIGDLYLLNKIKRTKEGYEVEIIEYLEDCTPMFQEDMQEYIIIRNLKEEEIGKITGENEEEKELIKSNQEKFSKKKIILNIENEELYISKVYE